MSCMTVVVYDHRPSHPYNAGTEHVGFSPTRQTLPAPNAAVVFFTLAVTLTLTLKPQTPCNRQSSST